MKRRDFITLLGGTVGVAWPVVARAQQPERVRRIGVLTGFAENDPEAQRRLKAFREGLRELGWTDGRNIRFEYRWGAGDANRIRSAATELVRLAPDVILVNSSSVLGPLQQETSTIPIVFVQINDPVAYGFVASLAHPGGNITGFAPVVEASMGGKWLELLTQIAPSINTAAVMSSSTSAGGAVMSRATETFAPSLGVRVTKASVSNSAEIEQAFEEIAQQPKSGLIVLADPVTNLNRRLIISLAERHKLPAVYAYRYFVADGGLISYGVDPADQYQQAASYIHRILKGERPADMPVQQPTKFKLIINLKTAKAIGLPIPEAFLLRADEVIE